MGSIAVGSVFERSNASIGVLPAHVLVPQDSSGAVSFILGLGGLNLAPQIRSDAQKVYPDAV